MGSEKSLLLMEAIEMSRNDIFRLLHDQATDSEEQAEIEFEAIKARIAGELIAYRHKHDISQKELADAVGVTQPFISQIENGDWNPSLRRLIGLILKLGGELEMNPRLLEHNFSVKNTEQ